jgi:ribosomal protein L24
VTFDDIKVGDKVIIPRGEHGTLATVEKVTKTQFTAGGVRFMKADGTKYGSNRDTWSRICDWAKKATPEAIAALEILNAYTDTKRRVVPIASIVQTNLQNLYRYTSTVEEHRQATECLRKVVPLLELAASLLEDYVE